METTNTVKTMVAQVEGFRRRFGMTTKNIRLVYVAMDADTVKVSRGSQGVIIRYDSGLDLYSLTYYVGFEKSEELEGVCFDQFEELVVAKLAKKIRF